MSKTAFINACVFGAIACINFFVLTPSFMTILIGILMAIVSLASFFFAIMMRTHNSLDANDKITKN